MYFLLTDETNVTPTATATFFVYGGLIVPGQSLRTLNEGIESIRAAAGYKPCDQFKFSTATRPDYVTFKAATEAKRQVLALAKSLGCSFIVHVILHRIIAAQKQDQQTQWAADYVIGRFNFFLKEAGDDGVCIIDNLPHGSQWTYLADKFCRGLTLESTHVPLDRIQLFAATCIGASHAMSAVDIVLGSFRYCINSPANTVAAKEMLGSVSEMMWHRKVGETRYVRGRGLLLRPEPAKIAVPVYRQAYEGLLNDFKELLVLNEDPAV